MQKLDCAKKPLPNLKDILPLANASYKTKHKCMDSAYKIFFLQLLHTVKPHQPDRGNTAYSALFPLPKGYNCLYISYAQEFIVQNDKLSITLFLPSFLFFPIILKI